MWPAFSMEWRADGSLYRIAVFNPEHQCHGVGAATLDGAPVDHLSIPLDADGGTHEIVVTLGRPTADVASSRSFSSSWTDTRL